MVCGVAWGLVNFGFLLWLPTNLGSMGMDATAASALLARSALLALPGIAIVIWLYHRWSSIKALVLFIALTAATLLLFFALGLAQVQSSLAMVLTTALLLVSSSGVIAMLIPYAAEIYPVHLRGTGSGVVAAGSKFGGILGAGFGVLGVFGHFAVSALLIARADGGGGADAGAQRHRDARARAGGHPGRARCKPRHRFLESAGVRGATRAPEAAALPSAFIPNKHSIAPQPAWGLVNKLIRIKREPKNSLFP